MPEIDETKIPANMLFRILPEESANEVAKNLLKDMANAPPPLFMQAGDNLYAQGNVDIACGDSYESENVTTSVEIGRDAVDTIISSMIDDSVNKEALVSLGYDDDEIVHRVGLFILSNVNGLSDLHNFAVDLFREIGTLAYYKSDGDMGTGFIASYIDDIIKTRLEKTVNIKEKFYWQGVQRHLNILLKSKKIADVKNAVSNFNDCVKSDESINIEDSVDLSYEQQVIDDVLDYLAHPINFLKDNPDMLINLTAYENEYGKLPRQPELPGLEQT